MQILACPIDKYHPLKLFIFARTETDEIYEGILVCPACFRWFPIIELIPELLPDELRNEIRDLDFLQDWYKLVPKKVLREGKPFNLGELHEAKGTKRET